MTTSRNPEGMPACQTATTLHQGRPQSAENQRLEANTRVIRPVRGTHDRRHQAVRARAALRVASRRGGGRAGAKRPFRANLIPAVVSVYSSCGETKLACNADDCTAGFLDV